MEMKGDPALAPTSPLGEGRGDSSESPLPRTTEKSPWVVLGDFGVVLEPARWGGQAHSHMLVQAPGGVSGGGGPVAPQFTPRPTVGKGRPVVNPPFPEQRKSRHGSF